MVRIVAVTAILVGAYRARSNGVDFAHVKGVVLQGLQRWVAQLSYAAGMFSRQVGVVLKR